MKKWEYEIRTFSPELTVDNLNYLGRYGWEMAWCSANKGPQGFQAVFKRPLPEPTPKEEV